jgi:hypothetical protein
MTRDSEIRKCKVLGEDWVVEIDYNDLDKLVCIDIYGEEGTRIRVSSAYDLEVIGRELVSIGKKLGKLSEEEND